MRCGGSPGIALALLLVASLWLSWPAVAKQLPDAAPVPPDPPESGVLDKTHDGHLSGGVPERLVAPGAYQRLPAIDESPWIVQGVRRQAYWDAGTFDPVLSNACARGEFVTPPTNRIVMRFLGPDGAGALQMVSPPYHPTLLYDLRKLAKPTETYYFYNTNEPNCKVWIDGKVVPRKMDLARGTALPKPDPHALKKREAQIKSWHKPVPAP